MSRISNNNQQPVIQKPQQKPSRSNAQKAGSDSAFASRMGKKQPTKKNDKTKSTKNTTSKETNSEALLKRHSGAPVMRRGKGTVADLQAQLEGKSGKGKKLLGQESSEVGKSGKLEDGKLSGDKTSLDNALGGKKTGLQDHKSKLDSDLPENTTAGSLAANNPLSKGTTIPSGNFQIKGNKIPTAMLDKMVENARVGVNAAGNTEFQFDLQGDVLGGLKMKMSIENGQLKATFMSENPEIRKLVDGNLQDLKRALEDRGIHIRDLEVKDPKEQQREQQRDQHQKERREGFSQE